MNEIIIRILEKDGKVIGTQTQIQSCERNNYEENKNSTVKNPKQQAYEKAILDELDTDGLLALIKQTSITYLKSALRTSRKNLKIPMYYMPVKH